MPCEMNLGDVKNASVSKQVLQIGSFDSVYADNVLVTDGKIVANSIELTSEQATSGFFLKHKNDKLAWEQQHHLWIYEPNIRLSDFFNNGNFVSSFELSSFAYDGDFRKFSNLPRKDDTIPSSYETDLKLFSRSNNLHELREVIDFNDGNASDIFKRVNQLFNNTLGNLAYEQEELPQVNTIQVKNFHLLTDVVRHGFLYSSTAVSDDLMVRNKVCWNNPFLTEDKTLKNEFKLVNNFLEDTNDISSVEISNIGYFKSVLSSKINHFQNNLDMDRVQSVITKNVEVKKAYLETDACLGDIDDLETFYRVFSIGTVASEDAEDAQIESMEVTSKLVYTNFDTDDFTNVKFYNVWNSNVIVSELESATVSNLGAVSLHNSFDNLTLDSFEHEVPNGNLIVSLKKETKDALASIEGNLRYFFNELEDPPDGMLDSNLSGYENLSNIDLQNLGVYKNLKIPKVCYTREFDDLRDIPQHLDHFNNDIPLLEKSKVFGGDNRLNLEEVMRNLNIGDISLQDDTLVNINGGKIVVNNAFTTALTISPPLHTNIEGNVLSSSAEDPQSLFWRPLQIGNETKYGIVKIMNSYKTASSDSVVTGKKVHDMYTEIQDKLNLLDDSLTRIENSFAM